MHLETGCGDSRHDSGSGWVTGGANRRDGTETETETVRLRLKLSQTDAKTETETDTDTDY